MTSGEAVAVADRTSRWSVGRRGWVFVLISAIGVGAAAVGSYAVSRVPTERHRLGRAPSDLLAGAAGRALPPPAPASTSSPCPEGMLLVDGIWCPFVGHRCLDWIDEKRDRCRRYDEKPLCEGRKVAKRFCIDRYEYPNEEGVYPVVMTDWIEAQDACKHESKRLCTESEWTFACEGVEQRPYPYGATRDPEACNIDRHYREPDLEAFSDGWKISSEVEKLDQRVRSGSMGRCVSPFGVHDMTGNVDEWVVNEDPDKEHDEDVSGLKGGYWGPIRARCRPITNSHNRWFRFYQVGFRCCSDPAARESSVEPH